MGSSKRGTRLAIAALMLALAGVLLTPGSASATVRARTLTNGQTLSVRSGDSCVVTPTAPTSGRKALRNFTCTPSGTPGPPPAQPPAPRIETLFAGDTLSLRSADGCLITPMAPSGGKNRSFTCVPPPPPPRTAGGSTAAGAVVGNAKYPVPAGAIVVSTTGNDAAPGTAASPLRTLGRAVAKAPVGATIVLRAGSYHESVVIEKQLTIQAWPRGVWLDGSSPVTGWMAYGSRWVRSGWTTQLDASPTYTRGAPDGTAPGWRFVNPDHPMAAHPDQVWIDGVEQRQVGALGKVIPGTFFHDETGDQLWLGSNPTAKQVRASDLVGALHVRAAVGRAPRLRRPPVRALRPGHGSGHPRTVRHPGREPGHRRLGDHRAARRLDIDRRERAAPQHLHRSKRDARDERLLRRQPARRQSGLQGQQHRALQRGSCRRWREAHSLRTATVRDSIFRGNDGTGLWMDESVYGMAITGNEMRHNTGDGTALELSSNALFADNLVTDNVEFGIKINNTSHVSMWNNTFVGNDRSINIVQDSRRPTSASTTGRDKRQPFPDPTMTWLNGPVTVANNIMAMQRSGECMLCVEDYSRSAHGRADRCHCEQQHLQPGFLCTAELAGRVVTRCRRPSRVHHARRPPPRRR